jgi:hypothetical protein
MRLDFLRRMAGEQRDDGDLDVGHVREGFDRQRPEGGHPGADE